MGNYLNIKEYKRFQEGNSSSQSLSCSSYWNNIKPRDLGRKEILTLVSLVIVAMIFVIALLYPF